MIKLRNEVTFTKDRSGLPQGYLNRVKIKTNYTKFGEIIVQPKIGIFKLSTGENIILQKIKLNTTIMG